MSLITDIADRIFGSGASTTLAGSGLGALLYSLADKFFPGASGTAASAQTDPISFWVGVALVVVGMIWHRPGQGTNDSDEPQ